MPHRSPRKRHTPPATPARGAAATATENPSPLKAIRTSKSQTSPHATTSQQHVATSEHTPHPFQLHQSASVEKVSCVIPAFASVESSASGAVAAAAAFVSNSIPPIRIHSTDTQNTLTSVASNTYSTDELHLSSLVPHFSPSLPSMTASHSSILDLHSTDNTHTNTTHMSATSQSHSNMSSSTSFTVSGTKSLSTQGSSTARRVVRPIRKIAPVFLGKVSEPSAPLADTESEAERILRSGEFTTLSAAAAEMDLHTPTATPRRETLLSDSTTSNSAAAAAASNSYEPAATTTHSSISSLSASFFAPSPAAAPFGSVPFFSPTRSPLQQVFDTQSRSPGGTTGTAPASTSQRRTGISMTSAFQQQLGNRTGRQLHTNNGSTQPHSFSTQQQQHQQQQPSYSFSSPQRPTLQGTPSTVAAATASSSTQSSSDFAAVLMGQTLPPQYLKVLQEAKAATLHKQADSAFASTYRPTVRAPTTTPTSSSTSASPPAAALAPISSTWSSFRFDSHAFASSFSNEQAAQSSGVQASSNLSSLQSIVPSLTATSDFSTAAHLSTSSSSSSSLTASGVSIPAEERAKMLQELENMFRTTHEAMAGLEPPPTPQHVDDHSSNSTLSLFRTSSASSESGSSFTAVASAAAAATAMATSSSPVTTAAIVTVTPSSGHLVSSFTPIPHSLSVHGEPLSHIPPALAQGMASATHTRRVAQELEAAAAAVRPPSVTNTVASTTPPPAPNTLLTLPLPSLGPLPPIPAFVNAEQLNAKSSARGRTTPSSTSAESITGGKRSRRGGVKRTSASLESTPVGSSTTEETAGSTTAPASEPTLRVKKRNVRAVLMQVEKTQQHMEWIHAATSSAAPVADATPASTASSAALNTSATPGVNLEQQLDLASTQAALTLSTPIVTEETFPALAFPSPLAGTAAPAVATAATPAPSSASVSDAAPQLYTSGPLQLSNDQNRQLRSQIQLHLQLLVQSYWLCTVIPPAPSRNHSRAKKFPFHAALKQQALGMIEQMEQAAKGNFSNHMAELIVNFSTNVTSSPSNAASQQTTTASGSKSKARGPHHQPHRSTSSNSSDSSTSSNSKLDELISSATKPKRNMHKRALLAEDEDDEAAAEFESGDDDDDNAGEEEVRVKSSSKGKESDLDAFLNQKVFDPQPVPYSMTQPVILPSHALPILNVPALHLWRDAKFEQINQTTPSNAAVPSAIVAGQISGTDEDDKENAVSAAAASATSSPYLGVYTKGANGRATLTLPVVAVNNFWGTLVAKYQLDMRYLPRILVHERHLFTSAEEHLFKMGVKMMQWEMKQQQASSSSASSSTALTTSNSSSKISTSKLVVEADATLALELQMLAAVKKRFLPAKSVNELRTRYEKVKAREQELNIKRKFMSVQTNSISSAASVSVAVTAGESPTSPSSPTVGTSSPPPSNAAATTLTTSPLAVFSSVLSAAAEEGALTQSTPAAGGEAAPIALPTSLDPASLPPLMELELQEVETLRDFTARELAIVSAAVEEPALKASRNKWSTISSKYLPLWPRKLLAKAWMKHTMKQAKQLLPHLAATSKSAPRKPRAKKGAEQVLEAATTIITSPELGSNSATNAFPLSSFSSPLPQSRAAATTSSSSNAAVSHPHLSSPALPFSAASTLAASAGSELLTPRVSRPKKKGLEFDCVGEEFMVEESEEEEEAEEAEEEVASAVAPTSVAKDLELLSKFPPAAAAAAVNLSAAMTSSPSTNPVAAAAAASTAGISMPHIPSFTPAKPAASGHFNSAA